MEANKPNKPRSVKKESPKVEAPLNTVALTCQPLVEKEDLGNGTIKITTTHMNGTVIVTYKLKD